MIEMSFLRILNITFLCCVTVFGTFGNCAVLFVIYMRKDLHTWTFILVGHLAVSDLIICSICAPSWIAIYASGEFAFCVAGLALSVLSFGLSASTLSLIAYERYMYIKDPFRYGERITKRKMVTLLTLIWVLVLLSTGPILSGGVFDSDISERTRQNCILNRIIKKGFALYMFGGIVIGPALVLIITYGLIYRIALKQKRKIHASYAGDVENSRRLSYRRQYKTFAMLFIIVGSFCLCLVPYPVFCLVDIYCKHCIQYEKHKYLYLLSALYFLNSSFNPVLYSIANQQFRKAVKRTICKLFQYPHLSRDLTLSSYSKAIRSS